MNETYKQKKIFNTESQEAFMDAKIVGGNPNGIMNFNRCPHSFAYPLYKKMIARTWFPDDVNISKDKVNYSTLNPEEKRMYDLVLAQLIANDSIQANQLADKINGYITSPIVNACLIRQAWEEANHAQSYAVMAEEICQDTDRIYNMHNHDEELMLKNKAVEDMYAHLYNGDDPKVEDLLMAMVANQILEELVFPGGFVALFSLATKLPGSAEMAQEIMKDEKY